MKTKQVIVFIFVLGFIISGCTSFSRDRNASTVDTEFHKGTQGLDMQFVKNNPPNLIYDYTGTGTQQEVTVMVELRNKGADDISNGRLSLSGFDKNIIRDISSGDTQFSLDGKSRFNSEGGFDVVTLTNERSGTVVLPKGVDNIQQNIIVHACYQYETNAAPVVCIDPDPYREVGEKACRSTDLISGLSGGQGAPVVITNVEEEMAPGKIFFKIHVSDVGGGTVVNQNNINDCPHDIKYKDIGDVHYTISANTKGTADVNSGACEPSSKIKLIDGKGTIYCNFDATTTGSAYKTPLNIILAYGYMDSISKQVEIRSTASPN